jgi:hypothetical protein
MCVEKKINKIARFEKTCNQSSWVLELVFESQFIMCMSLDGGGAQVLVALDYKEVHLVSQLIQSPMMLFE